uniref:BPL/LPL catalytic domain-containing protein n=1 Tax=Salix viminalis TaxID=40686 RepID=A0A6N2LAU5_SALVM
MGIAHEARMLINVVRFKGMPILEQLFLEEKLLRTSSDNWCIVNDGTSTPSRDLLVVSFTHGHASVFHLHYDLEFVQKVAPKSVVLRKLQNFLNLGLFYEIVFIRRFTGGGTVIVDHGTIFVTLICNKDDVLGVQPYPRSIMSWSGLLYGQVFRGIGDFQLRENEEHCKLLAAYDAYITVKNMAYLKLPARAPEYRLERDHNEFICRMKEYLSRSLFVEKTTEALETHFSLQPMNSETIGAVHEGGFVHTTSLLTKQELKDALASSLESIAHSS